MTKRKPSPPSGKMIDAGEDEILRRIGGLAGDFDARELVAEVWMAMEDASKLAKRKPSATKRRARRKRA